MILLLERHFGASSHLEFLQAESAAFCLFLFQSFKEFLSLSLRVLNLVFLTIQFFNFLKVSSIYFLEQ